MKESELIFGIMAIFSRPEYSVAQIKSLVAPFGVSDSCVRTTLSRMCARRQIASCRRGRFAYYRLGPKGGAVVTKVLQGFQTIDWSNWDNRWWGVHFSVPEKRREHRYDLKKKLKWHRFAPLYPGFWIRPLHAEDQIPGSLLETPLAGMYTLIRFEFHEPFTKQRADSLWGLSALDVEMRRTLERLRQSRKYLARKDARAAFVEKIELGGEVVDLLAKDPLLPDALLPRRWCASRLRRELAAWNCDVTERSRPFWEPVLGAKER